jgi:hypothetical protein
MAIRKTKNAVVRKTKTAGRNVKSTAKNAVARTKNAAVKTAKKAGQEMESATKKVVAGTKRTAKKLVPKGKVLAVKKSSPKKNVSVKVKTAKGKLSVNSKVSTKNKSENKQSKKPFVKPAASEPILPGENMHFIPESGETPNVKTPEAIHTTENNFHNREEVALHQENNKVNNALASRKNLKKLYNSRGRH